MKQEYESANTSINTVKLPAIYNKINWEKLKDYIYSSGICKDGLNPPCVLDYGCGKETKHIEKFLAQKGFRYLGYDPYWKSASHNITALRVPAAVCVCSNVLNVIKEKDVVNSIHNNVAGHPCAGRLYFISIYEGDKSLIGRETKKNCWQRNETADMYIAYHTEILKKKVITDKFCEQFIL